MIVSKKISFDAAHHLPGYKGKCEQVHGHHWEVEAAVKGKPDSETGMVIDFSILKSALERATSDLDHSDLNLVLPIPTAECIARMIFGRMQEYLGAPVHYVKVWETQNSMVMVEQNDTSI